MSVSIEESFPLNIKYIDDTGKALEKVQASEKQIKWWLVSH